ncbi:MAG: N-acetylglucosamine-6-phosphate deacetylase [Cyanobacteria bacterium HKST-UBA06]|nr:N-acetylglucosamine-6-phosphate deacetylase [Cyanobacteria bacterium HKST-UBA06]
MSDSTSASAWAKPGNPDETWRLITNGHLVLPKGEVMEGGSVLIVDGRIRDLYSKTPASLLLERDNVEVIDATGCWVTPGLIDQHINGAYGVPFNTATTEQIRSCLKMLLSHGVTSICPTLITASNIELLGAFARLEELMINQHLTHCRSLGFHLEGPFLNPEYRGAHPKAHLLPPTLEHLQQMMAPNLRILTLAPELDPYGDLVEMITSKGIRVNIGHTAADIDIARKAFDAGAKCVTHFFNAMPGFHHRKPGLLAAACLDDSVYVELIADGHHSAVDALALVMKLKPADRIILVSDANTLMGANVGQSTQFGGQRITLTADGSINEEGKLAGATCLLDGAIRNLVKWHLASFPQAVQMATANPARYLGENTHFGELKPDALADIALWDRQSLTIKQTLLQGRVVYEANQAEAAQKAS